MYKVILVHLARQCENALYFFFFFVKYEKTCYLLHTHLLSQPPLPFNYNVGSLAQQPMEDRWDWVTEYLFKSP
jgi:hypothetical protein